MPLAVTDTFLHLASGPSAAGVIIETVRRLGREETVLGVWDALADGPLQDVDAGATLRVEWWSRLSGEPLDAQLARELDDSDLWARVRNVSTPVLMWHGPHPSERIFALRACWHLRDQPERVHEVAILPSGRTWRSGPRPAFYDAAAIIGPNETVKAWDRRAKVLDVDARAKKWEALRARAGDWIRGLDGEEIVHRPVTGYDAELVRACSNNDWTRSLKVVARVLADNPTSDALLRWRIRELLGDGTLQGRGDKNRLGLPEEVRPRSPENET